MTGRPAPNPADQRPPILPRRATRVWLALEFTSLFVIIPLLLWFERARFGRMIIPSLVLLAIVFTIMLLADRSFDRRQLWNTRSFEARLRRVVTILIPSSAAMAFLTWWLDPEVFLRLPRENPRLWPIVMLGYPLFSVYPQEIIFRTFLFHRYEPLFRHEGILVAASAVSFGLAHIFFNNWLAPVLSTVGGWLFARTYARTRSTLMASLEHGLWGDVIFTIGLGWYFYGGAIRG